MLFPRALFLATKFYKNRQKFNFSIEFSSKIFKVFLKFPKPVVFFVQTSENLTHGFEIFFQNRRKYCIFCNFLNEFFCKFSKIFRRPGGSAPGPPTRPAITLNPRNFFLRTPLMEIILSIILLEIILSGF